MDYLDFVAGENRFASLTKSFPEEAERLFEQGKEDVTLLAASTTTAAWRRSSKRAEVFHVRKALGFPGALRQPKPSTRFGYRIRVGFRKPLGRWSGTPTLRDLLYKEGPRALGKPSRDRRALSISVKEGWCHRLALLLNARFRAYPIAFAMTRSAFAGVDRLGYVGVHAGFQAFAHVLLEGVACHRDDGDACGIGAVEGAYGPGSGQAVHLRHRHVHENGVEGSGGGCGERLHRLRTVAGDDTYAPSPSRIVAAISAFRSLSSTSSKRRPCRVESARCLLGFARGRSRVERDAAQTQCATLRRARWSNLSMEPPISSMSCLTMGMPKPVPPTVLATLDSRAKGSNTRFRNSGLIPMPVSVTSQRSKTLPSGSSLEVTCVITLPPGRLYLMQLL